MELRVRTVKRSSGYWKSLKYPSSREEQAIPRGFGSLAYSSPGQCMIARPTSSLLQMGALVSHPCCSWEARLSQASPPAGTCPSNTPCQHLSWASDILPLLCPVMLVHTVLLPKALQWLLISLRTQFWFLAGL